jgi:hypothetical protein
MVMSGARAWWPLELQGKGAVGDDVRIVRKRRMIAGGKDAAQNGDDTDEHRGDLDGVKKRPLYRP